jgi:hypothetical protein
MNSNTVHENDMLSFLEYYNKRRLELKGLTEKSIEEKASYEWKLMSLDEKMRYFKKVEDLGLPERRPNSDEL